MVNAGEPLVLGFGSGLSCLGSCGTLLLPWLAAGPKGFRPVASTLARFLGGRLLGYLAFAALAWALGWALSCRPSLQAWFYAVTYLAVAVILAFHALPSRAPRRCLLPRLMSRMPATGAWAPAALGFLTGINLCPPFLAALLRVGAGTTLPGALTFFLLFFVGTLPWFLPLVATGAIQRRPAFNQVARFFLLLLAFWYGYLGGVLLLGRLLHGH
jgi:sulfite exporter TauE/SafE